MENRAPQEDLSQGEDQELDDNHDTSDMDDIPRQGHSLPQLHAQLAQGNTPTLPTDEEEETIHATNTADQGEPASTDTECELSNNTTACQPPT